MEKEEEAGQRYEQVYENFRSQLDCKIAEKRKSLENKEIGKEWTKKLEELPKHDGNVESFVVFRKRIELAMRKNESSEEDKLTVLSKLVFSKDELAVLTCKSLEEAKQKLDDKYCSELVLRQWLSNQLANVRVRDLCDVRGLQEVKEKTSRIYRTIKEVNGVDLERELFLTIYKCLPYDVGLKLMECTDGRMTMENVEEWLSKQINVAVSVGLASGSSERAVSRTFEQALASRSTCFRCGKKGHFARECAYRSPGACFVCGKHGHKAMDCPEQPKRKPKWKKDNYRLTSTKEHSAKSVYFDDDDSKDSDNKDCDNYVPVSKWFNNENWRKKRNPMLEESSWRSNWKRKSNHESAGASRVLKSDGLVKRKMDKCWRIDSGATGHFGSNAVDLQNIKPANSKVVTASGEVCVATAIGDVEVTSGEGRSVVLKDVARVPDFDMNLLSVPKVCDDNCVVVFNKEKCLFVDSKKTELVIDDSSVKLVAERRGDEYVVPCVERSEEEDNVAVCMAASVQQWHERFGHPGAEKLSKILKAPVGKLNCESCLLSKCTRTSHPSVNRDFELMERISGDIIGPRPRSFGGSEYILHLVEHHSSYGMCYFLKTKNEAVKKIIEFLDLCETQTGQKLKEFLSDNGGEFVNYQLEFFLKQKGVKFLKTTPYTSQQNGKIERRNRTLQDCVRTLLQSSKLPLEYWTLAADTANYLINRWPSKEGDIPIEKFTGKKVENNHLKVFGSLAYSRICDTRLSSKFDQRGQKMVFVGYTETDKNYVLLDPRTNWITRTCDVTFDENVQGYEDIMKGGEQPTTEVSNDHDYCGATTFEEAVNSDDAEGWRQAMDKELTDLIQKGVYDVVDQASKKPLSTKWVLTKKSDGRLKARLVVRGFEQFQPQGSNYAPTLHISTLRVVLTMAITKKMIVRQFDISSAFLNADLDQDVFVTPPEGVGDKCWKLKKALYGLKRAPLAWFETLRGFLVEEMKLKYSLADKCVFFSPGSWDLLIAVYVDDVIIAAKDEMTADKAIERIKSRFDIHDYLECSEYLGMRINVAEDAVEISQTKYIEEVLERFGMKDCNPTKSPMDVFEDFSKYARNGTVPVKELLGCLNFLATRTRPDISVCISHLGTFADVPSTELWKAAKRVLRYLKGTKERSIVLRPVQDWKVNAYTDAGFRTLTEARCTSGSMVVIDGTPVAWRSTKQTRLAKSTCEAELVAALDAWKEAEPIRQLLEEMGLDTMIELILDSTSAFKIGETGSFKQSKYFAYDLKLMTEELIQTDGVVLRRVPTSEQLADGLTKPLKPVKLRRFWDILTQKGVL